MKALLLTIAGTALIAGLLGYGLGWKTSRPTPARWATTSAPSIRLLDGALVAERRYDPEAKPKQALPAGSRAERILSAVVTPRTNGSLPRGAESPAGVTLDLTLTREKDGSQRAVFSSPDGEITTGPDTWVIPPAEPRIAKHQVLTAYNWATKDAAAGYTRRMGSVGPVTFRAGGLLVYQDRKPGAYALVTAEW